MARANGVPTASAPQPRGTRDRGHDDADGHGGPHTRDGAGPTILIGTYNIQVFGSSKIAKPEVMQCLVHVVRQLDVVAIQEVRARMIRSFPRSST